MEAVLIGSGVGALVGELAAYGADKVHLFDQAELAAYATEAYARALDQVIGGSQVAAVLIPFTAMGKDLAPRVAAKVGGSLASDCVRLAVRDGRLEARRPMYAGKAYATVDFEGPCPMAILRPNVFALAGRDASRQAEVVTRTVDAASRAKVVRVEATAAGKVELTEAQIVVSAGRGIKGREAGSADLAPAGTPGAGGPRRAAGQCAARAFPGAAPAPAGASRAPVLIQEVSAIVGWDSGTMDPGPVGALQGFLTITARQLTGFSPEGQPLYGPAVTDRRSTRLEPGEEYLAPVAVEARGREALGVPEVLLRIRAGDSRAKEILAARYIKALQRLAHGRLPAGARGMFDTDDHGQLPVRTAHPGRHSQG